MFSFLAVFSFIVRRFGFRRVHEVLYVYDRIVVCPVRAVAIPTMCQENLKQDSCYSYVRCNCHYYDVVFFPCSRLIVK